MHESQFVAELAKIDGFLARATETNEFGFACVEDY